MSFLIVAARIGAILLKESTGKEVFTASLGHCYSFPKCSVIPYGGVPLEVELDNCFL